MPTQGTIEKAVKALDNMKEIVKNDMLEQGVYITESVVDQRLAEQGAICGGRKACAIGSLYIGYGIRPDIEDGYAKLPGVDDTRYYWTGGPNKPSERESFLKTRPGLRLAYDALNDAADKFVEKRDDIDEGDLDDTFTASIEALFEGTYGEKVHRKDMLQIINNAKRSILSKAA